MEEKSDSTCNVDTITAKLRNVQNGGLKKSKIWQPELDGLDWFLLLYIVVML